MSLSSGETIKASARRWKQYPEYRDSGVEWLGEIPEHWEVKSLRYLFTVVGGSTPSSGVEEYWEGDIPWVTPEDLGKLPTDTITTTKRRITDAGYESCGTSMVPRGSLIVSTRAPIGHLAIAGTELCTNQGCKALVFRRDDDVRFFYYQLLAARAEIKSWGQGSTFQEIGRSKLESIRLIHPPLPEQRAIADFLDRETARIADLIAKRERLIGLLEEKRTTLISHTVTKGLDPDAPMRDSGVEWLGEIPEHWEVKRLKWTAEVRSSNVDKNTIEGEQPVHLCNYTDVYYNERIQGNVEFMQATAAPGEILKFTLERDDVLITKDSESWDDIAVPAYVSEKLPGVLCGYHLALIRPNAEVLEGSYLARCFAADGVRDQFRVAANGIMRYGLSKASISTALFPLPPVEEQQTIADFLDRETEKIDDLISKLREHIEKLEEYRIALISAVVTGKIDVRDGTISDSESGDDQ